MAAPVENYESDVDSIEINVTTHLGVLKRNYLLNFKDEDMELLNVAEEKERCFKHDGQNPDIAQNFAWVILKRNKEEIEMDDNEDVIHYKDDLQNAEIITKVKQS